MNTIEYRIENNALLLKRSKKKSFFKSIKTFVLMIIAWTAIVFFLPISDSNFAQETSTKVVVLFLIVFGIMCAFVFVFFFDWIPQILPMPVWVLKYQDKIIVRKKWLYFFSCEDEISREDLSLFSKKIFGKYYQGYSLELKNFKSKISVFNSGLQEDDVKKLIEVIEQFLKSPTT